MDMLSEVQLRDRLGHGRMVERIDQMSPTYLEGIKRILTVSGDTELVSAPAYRLAAQKAPSANAYVSAMSIIQDEMAHAHIAYRMLEDLGVNKQHLVFERRAEDFKYPYAFDVPLDSWDELVVANALYDRAGFVLLSDVFQHTTFGPWKRALAKVDKEEAFHLRHGETWMRKLSQTPNGHARLQRCVDWMFPLTVEWFGLPDAQKKHNVQIEFGFKGYSNDALRQIWLSTCVPFLESLKFNVPARFDAATKTYLLTFPFPSRFEAAEKRWVFEEGQIGWDKVMERWKARGPNNHMYVEELQRGYHEIHGTQGNRSWKDIVA